MSTTAAAPAPFSPYQKLVVAILAFLQFTIVLDFMILAPLGALLMQSMGITPRQFGAVVSAYAFSAGTAGLLAAGVADRFDRKKMLLFFYAGFVLGTFLCGMAPTYGFLLGARIVTGLFGGVIGSISFAIIADLFPLEVRGRVMGSVQSAFAASQVMGIPLGVWLSTHYGWHAPFLMIATLAALVGVGIAIKLRPVTGHLKLSGDHDPVRHLVRTISTPRYLQTFAATMLLATGGFMLMPFGSAFTVNNLGIPLTQLHWVYMVTGVASIIAGPLMGRLSDRIGKYPTFCIGTAVTIVAVSIYCNLGVTPLQWVMLINIVLFVGVMARMISASALTTAVPDPQDRGAFMAVSSSLQQFSGGVASWVAGLIVVQTPQGPLQRYDVLGWVVVGAMLIMIAMMYPIHKAVMRKIIQARVAAAAAAPPGATPPGDLSHN
ncbi:MAG TPA: MFS transporter [Polyangia bacterium]|nr:MFS transporter [Polyangia bacterium]